MTDKWIVANRSALRAGTSLAVLGCGAGIAAVLAAAVWGGFSLLGWRLVASLAVAIALCMAVRAVVELSLSAIARERVNRPQGGQEVGNGEVRGVRR